VGHYSHVEEPARFVEILKDFLRTTAPANFDPEERRALLRQGSRNEAAYMSSMSADSRVAS